MNDDPSFLTVARVVQPMPIAPLVGLSFDVAVEQVLVLQSDPGGPHPGDLISVAHANAPSDDSYRLAGAIHRMRLRLGLPADAVVWSDHAVQAAEAWFCVERLDMPAVGSTP